MNLGRYCCSTFAAALLLIAASSSARATCGDYLHIPGAKGAPQSTHEPKSPSKAPCNGPHCSSAPRELPAPPAPIQTFDTRGSAILVAGRTTLVDLRTAFGPVHSDRVSTEINPNAIYHPPR